MRTPRRYECQPDLAEVAAVAGITDAAQREDAKRNARQLPDDGKPLTDLTIGKGRYYVDRILCENRADGVLYLTQPNPVAHSKNELATALLVSLDVWERHITHFVDDRIREVALGGPDTATRAQVVWQVRLTSTSPDGKDFPQNAAGVERLWPDRVKAWQSPERGRLMARAKAEGNATEPCLASPEASYRGTENQLYRLEIEHEERMEGKTTTWLMFKWSRETAPLRARLLPTARATTGSFRRALPPATSNGRSCRRVARRLCPRMEWSTTMPR